MESLEEEKLVQMVHDFIESESQTSHFSDSPNFPPLTAQTQYLFTLQEIVRRGTEVEEEVHERVLKIMMREKMVAQRSSSNLKKWLVTGLVMDGYKDASLCHSSWVTSFGCPAGDYEYIEIIIQDKDEEDGDQTRLIVDIDFKSQFDLARPTEAYKQLTNILPSIFVGTKDKLIGIISILCSAAKQSLRESGLHIPPWRTSAYMQSKWLSGCSSKSVDISTPTGKEVGLENGFTKWAPPIVKPKRRVLGKNGRGLSGQFSNMSINCC